MAGDREEDYRVGYRRPPRHTQFQKGQSGHRRGRPTGILDLSTALRKGLLESVTVREGGRARRMRKIDVAIRQQSNKAAAGDGQAFKLLINLLQAMASSADAPEPITVVISKADSML